MENAGDYYPSIPAQALTLPLNRKARRYHQIDFEQKRSARIHVCCPSRYLRLWNCPPLLNGQRRSLTQNIPHPLFQLTLAHVNSKQRCTYPHKTSTAVSLLAVAKIYQIYRIHI